MKYILFILIVCCFSERSIAGKADTVSIYSNSMHKYIKAIVIKPDSYRIKKNRFPVVYLLHGYDGWYSNWIIRVPELTRYADQYQMLIVCPDGAKNSWYFDSPMDTAYRYETHIAAEVVDHIDKNYKTMAEKSQRAITGLSMGGHGALFLALRHPGVFGAAGSMSGGVDLKESKNRYEISNRIGDTVLQAYNWQKYSVINLIENHSNSGIKFFIDCGDRDIFINGNRRLHQKMQQLKIPHTYIERPGEHNWDYWQNAIPFQLLYFQRFFQSFKKQ